MKKLLTRALPLLMAVVMVVAAIPFGASADPVKSFTEEFTSAEDFAEKWETVKSATAESWPAEKSPAKITTEDDGRAGTLQAAWIQKAPNPANYANIIKSEYWPGSETNRLKSVNAVVYVDEASTSNWYANQIILGYVDASNYLTMQLANAGNGYLRFSIKAFGNGYSSAQSANFEQAATAASKQVVYIGSSATGDYNGRVSITIDFDYSTIETNKGRIYYDYTVNEYSARALIKSSNDTTTGTQNFANIQSVGITHTQVNDYSVPVESFTCTFENSAEAYIGEQDPETPVVPPVVEKNYNPVIEGATIRRAGTQTVGFNCEINDIREDANIEEYGVILTINSYLNDGVVKAEDMVVGTTNEYVKIASSTDVSALVKGHEFTASIGNIPSYNYGVRYVAKVYIKYDNGTVDYSNVEARSVISVAKNISKWVFTNKDKAELAGLATPITDIIENVEGDVITYAYDVTSDNGVTILEYLEANNTAIANAYNVLNAQ